MTCFSAAFTAIVMPKINTAGSADCEENAVTGADSKHIKRVVSDGSGAPPRITKELPSRISSVRQGETGKQFSTFSSLQKLLYFRQPHSRRSRNSLSLPPPRHTIRRVVELLRSHGDGGSRSHPCKFDGAVVVLHCFTL